MIDCKVDVLGTEYSINFVEHFPERLSDLDETSDGCCNPGDHLIYIKTSGFEDCTDEGRNRHIQRVCRHELIHAFLTRQVLAQTHQIITARGAAMKKWLTGLQLCSQR